MSEIIKQELTSMNIKEGQLQKLKQLFPEVFSEGMKVDWEKLRLTLGDESVDTGKERYGMNWPGKSECFKTIQRPSIATLIPDKKESIDFDATKNIFIEGDNLETLKLLQKSYLGKIKLIYIDPPYNTGNDFIYPDNYSEDLNTYLAYTGQINDEGKKFSTNPETDGRFHSKWLNMIYPRIFLSKNLLQDEGIICVSIGENELSNLIVLMNEIFGEENQICIFSWKSRAKPTNAGFARFRPQKVTEYIVTYSKKSVEDHQFNVISSKKRTYPNQDYDGNYRTTSILTSNRGMFRRETMRFEIAGFTPDEDFRWKAGYTVIKDLYDKNRIGFGDDGIPFEKKYELEENDPLYPLYTFIDPDISGTAEQGKSDLNELIGNKHGLDTVKPVNLMKYLVATFSKSDDIILDFFAGSGTTCQAILELNYEDEAQRKFIAIQLPQKHNVQEAILAGFLTIADITKTRIKSAIMKLRDLKAIKADLFENKTVDLGYKVFKLSKSNFKIWDSQFEKEPELVQEKLFDYINHISLTAEQEAILYELLLKSGFDLNTPIKKLTLSDITVFSIADGQLLICLEKIITYECLKKIAELQPIRVICLDEAFIGENADALKTNAVQIMKSKGVVNFRTI
jgi:adenine-specific DNA-methyltransferase